MKLRKVLLLGGVLLGLLVSQRGAIADAVTGARIPCGQKLYEALSSQQETIHIAGYGLSEQELKEQWNHVIYSNADLFFVSDTYTYTLIGDRVWSVTPGYAVAGPELEKARDLYQQALDRIRAHYDPSWTQLQTALFFHDYLCMVYRYDESLTRHTAYEFLTDRTGVCQAYTLVYAALLNAYGIPCDYVVSREMNHTWNVVTIDGAPYNVDVTYDDPTADRLGKASHKHFLLSDQALSKTHRFTPQEGFGRCTDTRYDSGAVWEGVDSGFVPIGDSFYFIKEGDLYRWQGGQPEYLETIFATWFTQDGDGSYWTGNHSSLWAHGDRLLYNKPDCILSYAPDTGIFTYVYQNRLPQDIYGFSYLDGTLTLQLAGSPNEAGQLYTVEDHQLP